MQSTIRRRTLGAFAAAALALTVTAGASTAITVSTTATAAAVTTTLTRTVTLDGKTVTAHLTPVTLRGPGFEVLVQQADGSLVRQTDIHPESGWLGSVDGEPSATASGIIRADGLFEGQIVFDRGGTWYFHDIDTSGTTQVHYARGTVQPATYKWPASTVESMNVSPAPGQAGTMSYRWDIGFDLTNRWFANPGTIQGSVAKAIDSVDLQIASLMDLYETNALLQPAAGRVIIRASAGTDPYAKTTDYLHFGRFEWLRNQADANVDDIAVINGAGGGGLAFLDSAGTTMGVASVGGLSNPIIVLRHEFGHHWGVRDGHTGGPEGATINTGNGYHRFDGTELSAIFRYRDYRQGLTAPFTPVGTFSTPVPPYAALDLSDKQLPGVGFKFRPTANDHDANGDALTLASIPATSHFGGTLTRSSDGTVHYVPSVTTTADQVDWFEYVVRDATGKTATGIAVFRIGKVPPTTTWSPQQVTDGATYTVRNLGSGLYAAPSVAGPGALIQRAGGDLAAAWTLSPDGAGHVLKNRVSGLCAEVEGGSLQDGARIVQSACSAGLLRQQWKVMDTPRGTALVNVNSGKCAIVQGYSLDPGAALVQETCGLTLNGFWTLTQKA